MTKLGEGGGSDGIRHGGVDVPKNQEKTLAQFWRSPEALFFITATLTVLCFLSHFFYLLFVEPSQSSVLAKEKVFAYSSIPLFTGMAFFVAAILSFRKIKYYSTSHVLVLILVIIFGSLIIHGLIVFHTYLLRTLYGISGLLP
ncbi:MAG: hypothetical protein FWD08_01870 [Alphaproteobacteria bacterium]|nr:hypothetical protein [Alphaproteobacteria bacterium]